MNVPLSLKIGRTLETMKNNKSSGIDYVRLKQLKCECDGVSEKNSNIISLVPRPGYFPIDNKGLLISIQNSGSKMIHQKT